MSADPGLSAEELLTQARSGHGPALGQVLERYRGYLLVLARAQIGRRLQGKVDPADLAQEVFLEAHRHFPHFRGRTEGELVRWLRQILAACLANLLRHYYGAKRRDIRLERELAAELDESSHQFDSALEAVQSSPSQRATRSEEAVRLAQALQQLPEDYREVLLLRHFEGLTFPEVAVRMNRTVEATKKLWMRALDRLRRCLGVT